MKRILLCGATGHVGRHILKQLGANGHMVRALVRTEQQASDLIGFAQDVHRGDLCQPATLAGACSAIDTIISAAGASVHINTRGKASFREIDYAGHHALLDEARRAGVRKFVYLSTFHTPELLPTAYVGAKEDFARELASSGLDHQILRPTGFFSAFTDLLRMARKGPLPLPGDGSARTNPIDDEEVAQACVEAIDSTERERSIGGPDVLTRKQIGDLVFQAIRKPARYRRMPLVALSAGSRVAHLFQPRVADLTEFYAAVARHDTVAPVYGTRRLADYLAMLARYA